MGKIQDMTIGAFLEVLIGPLASLCLTFFLFFNAYDFVLSPNLYDKLLSLSTTLFGFLLAILTLIIQSNSVFVQKMREKQSYNRLIDFNKRVVISTLINALVSFILLFLDQIFTCKTLYIISSINIGIFLYVIINTMLFVLIFYNIIKHK